MAIKRFVAVASATFFVSLLFSLAIVQTANGMITETRKSALIKRLNETQLDGFGAFHFFYIIHSPPAEYFNELSTADALSVLKALNALDRIDVESAVDYVALTQHPASGGFGPWLFFNGTIMGFDLYATYEVVHALKEVGGLSKINQTALINFVLAGYNESLGAFSALMTEAYAKNYAVQWNSLSFRSWPSSWPDQKTYSIPNVLSTFSGVSILAEIEALNLINTTRTLDFIRSTQAANGLFKPYPASVEENLPVLSYRLADVDRDGTGIPYTYAAVSALNALGRRDILNQSDSEKIAQYILSCQYSNGNFYSHKDSNRDEQLYTYHAVMTLTYLGMQTEAKDALVRVQNHILEVQQLRTDDRWPFPQPQKFSSTAGGNLYGVFLDGGGDPLSDTSRAVSILNVTNGLSLLDQPTPRSMTVLLNMTMISALVTCCVVLAVWGFQTLKRTKKSSSSKDSNKAPPSTQDIVPKPNVEK